MAIDNLNERASTEKPPPAEGSSNPANKPKIPQALARESGLPKDASRVQLREVREGGEKKEVSLKPKLREDISKTLRDRLAIARSLQGEGRPLSEIDRMLLLHGEQAIRGMEENNFSLQDLTVSRSAIYDDLIQKSLATAQVIQDNRVDLHPALKKLPLFGRLFRQQTTDMQLGGRGNKFSTEYTKALHLENRNPQEIQEHLIRLNLIRKGINESLSVTDPLFDENPPSTHPLGDRSRYYYAVLDQLNGPEGVMQQKFGGKSYAELWMENPVTATEALYEANQRAVTEFAREAAKEILTNQKPKVDASVIEAQAKKLEEKPTQKDIDDATKKATEAQETFTEAEVKYNELNNPVKNAEEALRQSEIAVADFKDQHEKMKAENGPLVADLQKQITELISHFPIVDPTLKGEQKLYQQALIVENNKHIAALEQEVLKLQQETKNLFLQYSRAESDLIRKKADYADRLTKANANGLPGAKTEFDGKKADKETADKELKNKKAAAQSEATPENKKKAKKLREWIKVYEKYLAIMDSSFNQAHGSEFTRERIARTFIVKTGTEEQVEGAETLREMILRQANPENYNPELAREMCSDEALAQAIIWTYNVLPDNPALKDGIGANKKGRELLLAVLPSVRSSQFKLGDMLRFIIHEGLKSAEKGNPDLTFSSYFTETQAEIKPTVENTASKEAGTAKIEDDPFTGDHVHTWEGKVTDSIVIPNRQTYFRVIQKIQGADEEYEILIKTDQEFIQALPDDASLGNLPPAVEKAFYSGGHKRTDLVISTAEWISLGTRNESDYVFLPSVGAAAVTITRAVDKAMEDMRTNFSEQLPTLLCRATVNYVLDQNPAERLKILRGIARNITVPAPERGVFSINLDNYGNFTIETPEMGVPQELRAFERQLEDTGQQELLATIQSTLGREIIVAQQRR